VTAVEAYVAGKILPEDGSLAEQSSVTAEGPDFAQGLAVQRAMDMLIIEFNGVRV
jgi:hypothetical protein